MMPTAPPADPIRQWLADAAQHWDMTPFSRSNVGPAASSARGHFQVAEPLTAESLPPHVVLAAFTHAIASYGDGKNLLFGVVWSQQSLCAPAAITSPYPNIDGFREITEAARANAQPLDAVLHAQKAAAVSSLWGATVSLESSPSSFPSCPPLEASSFHLEWRLDQDCLTISCIYAQDTLLNEDAQLLCHRFGSAVRQMQALAEAQPAFATQQDMKAPPPADDLPSVPAMISRIAQKHANAIAVEDGQGTTFDYCDLDSRSDAVAMRLLEAHDGAPLWEKHVAFMFDKASVLQPVSILAILKAGGCVTPLMSSMPDERMTSILVDCQAPLWVVDGRHYERAKGVLDAIRSNGQLAATLLIFEDLWLLPELQISLPSRLNADGKAFAIYTSGSTGVPKAVILEHRNLSSFADASIDGWKLQPNHSRLLQFSAPIWDVSIGDFICTFTRGATLVLTDREAAVQDVNAVLRDRSITHAILTPTVASLITERVPSLEAVFTTGEALPIVVRNRLLGLVPDVINGGAPTETTILALATKLRTSDKRLRWTPFGKPLRNVAAYVLPIVEDGNARNDDLKALPIGSVGELCIAGSQVSRGYLNRPEETTKVFSTVQGQRLYRSGDYARLRADGSFELLGRKDGQFKHRGVRLEADEIIFNLFACAKADMIQSAAVFSAPLDGGSEPTLTACLVLKQDDAQSCEEIIRDMHASLQTRLASYALPEAYVILESFPSTASGKLDSRSLQNMVSQLPSARFIHPRHGCRDGPATATARTPTEIKVAAAFADALRYPDPSSLDVNLSYTALGGDSLTLVGILSRLRGAGVSLDAGSVLNAATIAQVSKLVDGDAQTQTESDAAALDMTKVELSEREKAWVRWRYGLAAHDIEDMYFSTYYQASSATLGYVVRAPRPQSIQWNQAAWTVSGTRLTAERLRNLWDSTAETCSCLRTGIAFTQRFRGVVIVHKPGASTTQLKTFHPKDDADFDRCWYDYMEKDRNRGYDRMGAIGFRLALFSATENRLQKLVISFQHALADGWSMHLFLNALMAKARGSPTSPSATSFRPFAQMVHARDQKKLISWWTSQLLPLAKNCWPIDFDETPTPSPITDRQYDAFVDLDLPTACGEAGVNPFTATMAAYLLALYLRQRPEGSSEAVVPATYVSSGRFLDHLQDQDRIVGPALDFLMVKATINEFKSVGELLQSVSDLLNKGRGKEHVSHLELWQALNAARGAAAKDLTAALAAIQTSITFQNLPPVESPPNSTSAADEGGCLYLTRAEEHMATAAALYIQVFMQDNRVLIRTAYDDRLVGWDKTHRFVDDIRVLLPLLVQQGTAGQPLSGLLESMPDPIEAAQMLSRGTPVELNPCEPNPPSWWIKWMVQNIGLALWFSWFGSLLGLGAQ